MRKLIVLFIFFYSFSAFSQSRFHLGLQSEFSVENMFDPIFYGLMGKYDITERHNVQGSVYFGNNDTKYVTGDYIYNFFIRNRVRIYAGAGIGAEWYKIDRSDHGSELVGNGQIGTDIDLYKKISVNTGFKVKYFFDYEHIAPHYIFIGLRYRLGQ